MEKYGLTVPAVLDRVSLIARGRSVIVATDDRSPSTLERGRKARLSDGGPHYINAARDPV